MDQPRVLGRSVTRALAAAVLSAAVFLPATAQAPGDFRVALVIGNGAYPGGAKLVNPRHDADAVSHTLRSLGFSVVDVRDGSRPAMTQALTRAVESLKGRRAIGMLYYAGHGVQLDWRNYMIPVDARFASATDLTSQAVDVASVIDAFKAAGNRMNIIVLDACRDNPFGVSASRGLAPLDAPTGTFLAYATAPGNVAEDGDDASGNGLYTRFLVQELQRPGARIEDVFKRVRIQVRQTSNGRQIPWESTSLEEDFSFSDPRSAKPEVLERMAAEARRREQELLDQAAKARERERQLAAELERERQAAAAREDKRRRLEAEAKAREQTRMAAAERAQREQEERDRKEALEREAVAAREKEKQIAEQLERERRQQAAGAEEARRLEAQRIALAQPQLPADSRIKISPSTASDPAFRAQRDEWERVSKTGTAQDLYAFLLKYPSGVFAEQAQIQLDALARPAIEAQHSPDGVLRMVPGVRFRVGDKFTYNVRDIFGKESRRVREIARIDGDRVLDSEGGLTDLLGNDYKAPYELMRSAPLLMVPPEITIGKRWDSVYRLLGGQPQSPQGRPRDTTVYSFRVLGVENITLPAGKFRAYKIEGVGYDGNGWRNDVTYWLDGRTHLLLKEQWHFRNSFRPDGYMRELVSAVRVRE